MCSSAVSIKKLPGGTRYEITVHYVRKCKDRLCISWRRGVEYSQQLKYARTGTTAIQVTKWSPLCSEM